MSRCLVGRTATLALRKKGGRARYADVVFPATWSRSTLLTYARAAHRPAGETVRIVKWHDASRQARGPGPPHVEPKLWLANPEAFTDFAAGVLA